jgi:transcriptional regulator with PAS, ATPase and Fis domain
MVMTKQTEIDSGAIVAGADPALAVVRVPKAAVVVRRDGEPEQQIELALGPVRAGALRGNEVVIGGPGVAPIHLELRSEAAGVRVRCVGDAAPVRIGDLWVRDALIGPVGTFQLGSTVFQITCGGEYIELVPAPAGQPGALIGRSPGMRELLARLPALAASGEPVLIVGERGTGKARVAGALHSMGPRAEAPFVKLSCALGLPGGEEPEGGAGVQAAVQRSRSGVLFLDELEALLPGDQESLLRGLAALPLEERPRIIASATQDLAALVSRGQLRSELLFLFGATELRVPPLRERREDLPLLVQEFLVEQGEKNQIDAAVMAHLLNHGWPGNLPELRLAVATGSLHSVRLLAQFFERAHPSELRLHVEVDLPYKQARDRLLETFRHLYVQAALERSRGNLSEAARSAGVDRMTFYRILNAHSNVH